MSSSDTHQTDSYNPAEVERKWQARWDEQGVNTWIDEQLRSAEKPFYNLMMFPLGAAKTGSGATVLRATMVPVRELDARGADPPESIAGGGFISYYHTSAQEVAL